MTPKPRIFTPINLNMLATLLVGAYLALHGKSLTDSAQHIAGSQDTMITNQGENKKLLADVKNKVDTMAKEFAKFKEDLYKHLDADAKEVNDITAKNMEQDSRLELQEMRLTSYIKNHY